MLLRMVPTFVTTHVFEICEVLGFPMGAAYRDIFAWFKTMWRKQHLASALGIQKESWG